MKKFYLLFSIILLLLMACDQRESHKISSEKKLLVAAVNYPLAFFAQQLGGDLVEVYFPIPSDEDPAYWTPTAEEITQYQNSDLILLNGAGYAKWVSKVSLPGAKLVNTTKGLEDQYIELAESTTHSHGPGGQHEHQGYAFTTWLNFEMALYQGQATVDALTNKMPGKAATFEANFASLKAELKKLHADMKNASAQFQKQTLYGSHPVYQYLAEAYELNILSEHWEPDAQITDDQWEAFDRKHKKKKGNTMLWEANPTDETIAELKKRKINIVVFSPCFNLPETGDFLSEMNNNVSTLMEYKGQ